MENNENQTPVTEEVKTETPAVEEKKEEAAAPVEEKKEEPAKKEKSSLFARKKKPWEEDVPKDPLTTKDMVCIGGFVLLLIVAFAPYFLRFLDPSYDDSKSFSLKGNDDSSATTTKKTRKKLTCNKTGTGEGYNYTEDIINTYTNGNAETNEITFTVEVTDPNLTNDTIEIEDYKTISEIASPGITATHEVGSTVYKITINYSTDEALRQNPSLSGHFKGFGIQKGDYEEKGFSCTDEKLEG